MNRAVAGKDGRLLREFTVVLRKLFASRVALLSSAPSGPVPQPTGGVFAADALADSVGVNVHLTFRGDYWGQAPAWKDHLLDLGVRTVRSALWTNAAARADFLDLHARGGVRLLAPVARNKTVGGVNPVYDPATVAANIAYLRNQVGLDKLVGIEGPNEPNVGGTATRGWETRVREVMGVIRAHAPAGMPVIAPALWKRIPADYALLGDLGILVDRVNLHNYAGGQMPSLGLAGDGNSVTLDRLLADASAAAGGKPVWVTETQYPVADAPSFQITTPEIAAKYLIRALFLNLKKGIERTSIYALGDMVANPIKHGLLAVTGTGAAATYTPRPSFHAIKRLLAHMADPGEAFTPAPLAYTLEGDTTDVERVLFQRRDGTWTLALWQEVSLWNRRMASEIQPPVRNLTLRFPQTRAVTVHAPNFGVAPSGPVGGTVIPVAVPGHVLLLDIA